MPNQDKEKYNHYTKLYMRGYRAEKLAHDEEHKAKEKLRKAEWYKANKEKSLANQRRYRQEKKEQLVMDLLKKSTDGK
ncbi:hypothetical protein OAI07_01175 [Akkermansiaceae bacterium]|nr:hypothetical protein [Akkermansiaceae bacterium]